MALCLHLTSCNNNTETRTVPSKPNKDRVDAGVARPPFATCSAPDHQTLARLDDDDLELRCELLDSSISRGPNPEEYERLFELLTSGGSYGRYTWCKPMAPISRELLQR